MTAEDFNDWVEAALGNALLEFEHAFQRPSGKH
jgi:hypothetical protein